MSLLVRFFRFWSGVDSDLLQWCPQHERGKYLSMGALVLLTGAFALMSSGYAFFTVFESVPWAVLLGAFWALYILNLDRLLLTTFPKTLGGPKQAGHALIRVVLAVFIGITIAHPLTVRMFQAEIVDKIANEVKDERERLGQKRDAAKKDAQNSMFAMKSGRPEFGEVEQRKGERDVLETQLKDCESQMLEDKQKYLCEADGTCGTGIKRCGPVCEEKKSAYRTTETRCQSLQLKVEQAISSLTQAEHGLVPALNGIDTESHSRDAQIDRDYRDAIVRLESIKRDSFFARSEAMGRLGGKAQTKALFVMLSLIFIETAAVLLKVMTPADSADKLAAATSETFGKERIPVLAETLADTGNSLRTSSTSRDPDPAPASTDEPDQRANAATVRSTSEWRKKALVIAMKAFFVVMTMLIAGGMLKRGYNPGEAFTAAGVFVALVAFTAKSTDSKG